MQDINDLTTLSDAPIEISIKLRKRKAINFHCGKTELTEKERKTGWCATKLDAKGTNLFDVLLECRTAFISLSMKRSLVNTRF